MDEAFPKPSKLLIVTSVAVIALGLWLLGLAIGSLVASLHPCSIMALLIVLPLILAIPVQQYRGTFRRVASAAMMMATLMYVTGVFVAFGGAVAILEALIDGPEPRWDLVLFFSIWPVIGLLIIALGCLNSKWSQQLDVAEAKGHSLGRKGHSLRELMGLTAAVAVVAAMAAWAAKESAPSFAEHVPASMAPVSLPAGASDISYARVTGVVLAYEFNCDEADFRLWCAAERRPLSEIDRPVSIARYISLAPDASDTERHWITSGLHYSWTDEDRGVHAAYDRETGRGYYYSHSR